jgi:hypothetical protein
MNVLLVSIAFPPKRDAESLQVAKYFSALTQLGEAEIDVVTSALPTLYMPTDEGLRKYARGYRQLVEVDFFEHRYTNFALRKLVPSLMQRPDSRFPFPRKWKSVVKSLRKAPDVIYSRSFPLSSTLMAYRLACHFDVPWVLHLGDPWTVSPIHSIAAASKWNLGAEAECFARAAAITVTSSKTAEVYSAKYPEYSEKFLVYPNVYEAHVAIRSPWTRTSKLRVVHTGGMVGTRSPAPMLDALDLLEKLHPEVRREIEVVFAGPADRANIALLAENATRVRYLGDLPLKAALQEQRDADLLLLIDSSFTDPSQAMFFPSKLLDYVAAQRRVIAITDPHSTTWDVMAHLGLGDRTPHGDAQALCGALVQAWRAWNRADGPYFERTARAQDYEAAFNAQRLMKLLQSLVSRGSITP